MKKDPEWKQYEWLITKIFYDDYKSLEIDVLYDTKEQGIYSEIERQVDIKIVNIITNQKTLIDCKDYSRKVDVKDVEQFLGMFSDIRANFGIMVTPIGFTETAYRRIKEFDNRIVLETIDWKQAYDAVPPEIEYSRIVDRCFACSSSFKKGREIPGLLCWEFNHGIDSNCKVSMLGIGTCLKCREKTIYCDVCGLLSLASQPEGYCCELVQIILEQT